jgi:hypothetical protein
MTVIISLAQISMVHREKKPRMIQEKSYPWLKRRERTNTVLVICTKGRFLEKWYNHHMCVYHAHSHGFKGDVRSVCVCPESQHEQQHQEEEERKERERCCKKWCARQLGTMVSECAGRKEAKVCVSLRHIYGSQVGATSRIIPFQATKSFPLNKHFPLTLPLARLLLLFLHQF